MSCFDIVFPSFSLVISLTLVILASSFSLFLTSLPFIFPSIFLEVDFLMSKAMIELKIVSSWVQGVWVFRKMGQALSLLFSSKEFFLTSYGSEEFFLTNSGSKEFFLTNSGSEEFFLKKSCPKEFCSHKLQSLSCLSWTELRTEEILVPCCSVAVI